MNPKIRTLMIALPLAAAGFTVATPGLAMAADQPGPVIIQPVEGDPKPMDFAVPTPTPDPDPAPQPDPQVPDDKAPAPQDDPQGPDDKAPLPHDDGPEGPGDLSNGEPCPTHGVDCTPDGDEQGDDPADEPTDQGCFTGCDLPETQGDDPEVDSIAIPTRVDAGLAGANGTHEGGLELTWLLAAGGLVTATGAAYAARARSRARA